MRKTVLYVLGLSAILALTVTSASATPVLWTLDGVTFSDGGTASGSFVFDEDTLTYSSISLVSTPPMISFTTPGPTFLGFEAETLWAVTTTGDLTDTPVIVLSFTSPLSNTGGTVQLETNVFAQGTCAFPTCTGFTPTRVLNAGQVTGTIIPEPASAALSLLALGMVGAAVRRNV